MATMRINGTELYVEEMGSGPLLLTLHGGLGLDHTYFRPAFDRFAERFRLVYYDHRCNGRSERADLSTLTLPQLADDADALREALGEREMIALGHSYGGFIALELAKRHPGSVRALVLADTAPRMDAAEETAAIIAARNHPPEVIEAFQNMGETNEAVTASLPTWIALYVYKLEAADVLPVFRDTIVDVAAMGRSMEALTEWDVVDDLSSMTMPALAIAGRHDFITPASQTLRIAAAMPNARAVIVEDTGHFPWLEDPGGFFGEVDAFLDGVMAGSPDAGSA